MSLEENLGSIVGARLLDPDGQHPGMGLLGWFAGRQSVRNMSPRITSVHLERRGIFIVRGKAKREDITIGSALSFNSETLIISRLIEIPRKWGDFIVEALPYSLVAEHITENGSYEFAGKHSPEPPIPEFTAPSPRSNPPPSITFDPRDRW